MEKDISKTIHLYTNHYFSGSKRFQRSMKRLEDLYSNIKVFSPKTLLDVGCGIGYFVDYCRKHGIKAEGIDFAPSLKEYWWKDKPYFRIGEASELPFADKSFDIVFSSDFFEHVPEEEVSIVNKEMHRVGKVVIAKIAFEADLHNSQVLYHCTNKPKEWWVDKLKPTIVLEY